MKHGGPRRRRGGQVHSRGTKSAFSSGAQLLHNWFFPLFRGSSAPEAQEAQEPPTNNIPKQEFATGRRRGAPSGMERSEHGYRRLSSRYTIGNPNRSRMLESENPPITAMASDCCICPPELMPSASGKRAKTAASVVIKIGRARTCPALTIASSSDKPSAWKPLIACMTKIAFSATIPMMRMTPTKLEILNVTPASERAPNSPRSESALMLRIDSGTVDSPNS